MVSKARQLKLDGLDALREELDNLHEVHAGWVFRLIGADEPHPLSAVQVEGYSKELKKLVAILLYEEHIIEGDWVKMVENLSLTVAKVTHGAKQ